MTTETKQETERFAIEEDMLLRLVYPNRGQVYVHRCEQETFVKVCHTIDDSDAPFTGEELVKRADLPHTQVFTALAFLKEKGCVVVGQRKKHKPATEDVYADAMIEWHALAEVCAS